VIGATKTRGPERVWCRLWYRTNESNVTTFVSRTVQAKIKVSGKIDVLKLTIYIFYLFCEDMHSIPNFMENLKQIR
jgi:hypothetical protein